MSGILYGIGVGPGDPELITVRAARLIREADVVAYHSARPGRSLAREIAAPYLVGQVEEELVYPVTRGTTDHVGGYAGALNDFYAESAERLARHLAAGRSVTLLAEGDPTLFSSYMHMHKRLSVRFRTVIVPGVTSVAAAAATAGTPLVEADEILTILPATLPPDELAGWLRSSDAAAILKVSRDVDGVRDALRRAGKLDRAQYVSRASHPDQNVVPFADVDTDDVPYMATVVVPGPRASGPAITPSAAEGEVVVVGLGPAGAEWLSPEARQELAAAEHIVGYVTYVDRVPFTARQHRHASDNRVEAERAVFALDLARRGARVAVVSGGDAGVFGMAAAVLEARTTQKYEDVPVRIVPGITAAQAVASRVGAPLGHDFCVLSLSDQLKSWDVIAQRLDAIGRADLVVALYNPSSRRRRHQILDARDILLRHRDPATPVVLGRAVGEVKEEVRVIRLGELSADDVDMRTLVIVGSSRTVAQPESDGRTSVYTPRHY